jgi:hypothetical protein
VTCGFTTPKALSGKKLAWLSLSTGAKLKELKKATNPVLRSEP